jgi:hypothetical protein
MRLELTGNVGGGCCTEILESDSGNLGDLVTGSRTTTYIYAVSKYTLHIQNLI